MALVQTASFAGTTVDRSQVDQYLFSTEFKMLNYAQDNDFHPLAVVMVDRMEWIGLQIRHYVAGYTKTLHRTLKEIRSVIRDFPDAAAGLTQAIIDVIRGKLLECEWFELMNRLDYASKEIAHLMKQLLTQ